VSLLQLKGVSRSFGGLKAVQGVDMTVEAGRITGLVGPNGAGKTTLVNLATGFLRLSSGRVLLDERDVTELQPHEVVAAGIARTFQQCRLLNEVSVAENIRLAFDHRSRTSLLSRLLHLRATRREGEAVDAAIAALLGEFGIEDFKVDLPPEISYGHQRRVEIARALAMEPRVLVLDEPAAGLIDSEATELSAVLRARADRGLALLLIEHNMSMVMSLCDDIYVLDSGEIIAHGRPDEIRSNPRVLRAYLGDTVCSA